VTRCGYRRGSSFEGCEVRRGEGDDRLGNEAIASETRRTPGSAAGCNKPASALEEEAVEVVRNHEDGTYGEGGSLGVEAGSNVGGSGLRSVVSMKGRGVARRSDALSPTARIPREEGSRAVPRASGQTGVEPSRTSRAEAEALWTGAKATEAAGQHLRMPAARASRSPRTPRRQRPRRRREQGSANDLRREAREGSRTRVKPILPASSKTP
jgi:hypothetical protein